MKFFNSRIVTTDISLEDAVKKAQQTKPQEAKSLDELIADIDAKNKGVKTAATNAETKTADIKPKTEVKVEVSKDLKKEAKKGEVPEEFKEHQFTKDDEGKDEDEDEEEKEEKEEKEDAKCAGDKCASTSKTLKIAKSLDFRGWEAEDVVKAWDQHGSLEGCMKNVAGNADDPKMYCGLLQVASQMAKDTLVKQASAPKKKNKKAAVEKSKDKGVWKVLAKLTDKERAMLDAYWRKLYGDYYVDAMLADY